MTATLNASRIDGVPLLDAIVDPADAVSETDETNNDYATRVLRADLGLDGTFAVHADPEGARVEFVVRNTDTAATTPNVTVETLALTVESAILDADLTDNAARQPVRALEPARNASARPLEIVTASGELANGTVVLTLVLHDPGNRTTGEVATVGRNLTGDVRPSSRDAGAATIAREPVAVPPGTTTVTLGLNTAERGHYTVSTANDTATVRLEIGFLPACDPDGDGKYEDVNGDRAFNVIDVSVLLTRFDDRPVRNNLGLFEFNDDGNVDILDVTALLGEV